MELTEHTNDVVRYLNPPCKLTQIKLFLSLCNVIWKFVLKFLVYLLLSLKK